MYLKQSYRDTDGSRSHHLFALVVAAASAAAIVLLGDIFNQDCLPERRKEVFCCFFAFFCGKINTRSVQLPHDTASDLTRSL